LVQTDQGIPDLKIALSEGGTGWIPYFLERADRTFEMHSTWTHQDFGGKVPSEVFREHFLTCFISDPVGVKLRNMIGIDNIAWEADYPHSDSMWPSAPEELWDVLSLNNVPDDEINKMTYENAMRWYSFDPSPTSLGAGDSRRAAQGRRGARRVHPGPQPTPEGSDREHGRFRAAGAGRELGTLDDPWLQRRLDSERTICRSVVISQRESQ